MDTPQQILIRYGELGLKGGNRNFFERTLRENLKRALKDVDQVSVRSIRGRIMVSATAPSKRLAETCSKIFGVTSVSPVIETNHDPKNIIKIAVQTTNEVIKHDFSEKNTITFRTKVKRAEKRFPMRSAELEKVLAEAILPKHKNLVVQLKNPQLKLEVDIRSEGVWIFARRLQGPGGLPVGTMGRGFCLLSGGIDSPVAAWLAMKRGMRMDFISFYSFPHVGPQSREKFIRLAEQLSKWQNKTTLHIVPFARYQEEIRDQCPPAYRTILYRRAMQRLASKIASRRKGKALITGESIGQVASQTLENIAAIEEASYLPIIRPLITYDKTETINLAKKIETFAISNLPAPDCCTVFQPESPIIYGKTSESIKAETFLNLRTLDREALQNTERIELPEK